LTNCAYCLNTSNCNGCTPDGAGLPRFARGFNTLRKGFRASINIYLANETVSLNTGGVSND
jgi:hypothetical protein